MTTFSFHPALPGDVNVPATLNFGEPFIPQVQKILESAGSGLMDREGEVTVSGQAVAAILMAAGLEMIRGLPKITLYGFGAETSRLGGLNLGDWRHNVVRPHRSQIEGGMPYRGITVLDGSGRGLVEFQFGEIKELLGLPVQTQVRVINVNVGQVDFSQPTEGMVEKLLATGLTTNEWASREVFYLPAGAGLAAVVQATAIHGLSESWPRTIRLAKGDDGLFHVAEVVDPQDMRQWGTAMTAKWMVDLTNQTLSRLANNLAEYGISAKAKEGVLTVTFPDGGVFNLAISSAKVEKN